MNETLLLLILEHSEEQSSRILDQLRQGGLDPRSRRVGSLPELMSAIVREPCHIIIADINVPGFDVIESLKVIKSLKFDIPVILLTDTIGEEIAARAMKAGAQDYILKDKLARLCPAVERELKKVEERARLEKTEETLEEQRSLLDELFQNISEGIGIVDTEERIIFCNPAYAEIFEAGVNDLVGTSLYEFLDESSSALVLEQTKKRRDGNITSYELPIRTKKQNRKHLLVTVSPRLDRTGRYRGAFGAVLDVTDRKLAENELKEHHDNLMDVVSKRTAQLRRSYERLQQEIADRMRAEKELAEEKERLDITLRSIADGVITTGTDGKINLINKAAEDLTGWSLDEARGKDLDTVFVTRPMDSPAIHEHFSEMTENTARGTDLSGNVTLVSRNGSEKIISYSVAPIRDRNGYTVGSVFAFHDISEKRQMEEELLKASKLESLGVLAGGIAHDFNNILTALFGNISNVKMNMDNDEMLCELLTEAETAYERARNLTHQLLTFSKGGAPVRQTASLMDLVRDTVKFALSGSRISCTYSLPDDLWSTEIDEGQISQVIHNLTINAVQAMPDGGTIEVEAENIVLPEPNLPGLPAGDYVKISIRDFGTGIPRENLHKIFDPYFTTKQRGGGLGLATSYSIVKRHDGHISVESEVGKGTVFRIHLPASEIPYPLRNEEFEEIETGEGRVLLMDDDDSIRTSIGMLLHAVGYDVVTAKDGYEVLRLYRTAMEAENPFDVVIMDLTIPGGMGGKETILKLRELDPSVCSVVSSGYSNDPIMAEFRKYGFKAVVAKPYTIRKLTSTLSRVLDEKPDKNSPEEFERSPFPFG